MGPPGVIGGAVPMTLTMGRKHQGHKALAVRGHGEGHGSKNTLLHKLDTHVHGLPAVDGIFLDVNTKVNLSQVIPRLQTPHFLKPF